MNVGHMMTMFHKGKEGVKEEKKLHIGSLNEFL